MTEHQTLGQHLAEWRGQDALRGAVAETVERIADACCAIAEIIALGPLAGSLGETPLPEAPCGFELGGERRVLVERGELVDAGDDRLGHLPGRLACLLGQGHRHGCGVVAKLRVGCGPHEFAHFEVDSRDLTRGSSRLDNTGYSRKPKIGEQSWTQSAGLAVAGKE
jgi:hypothetical protein